MPRLTRLLRYVGPYSLQLVAGVVLMAGVGMLEAFRLLLIAPVLDRVLKPGAPSTDIILFQLPKIGFSFRLRDFVPAHLQNDWTVVAYALVVSTLLKGICDYAGNYLVNYAGFGMITDLRNALYKGILKRSAAFFQRHTTGTLLSTIVNDIERVQYAMSSVLGEFLQQLFTFVFTAGAVIVLGGKFAWVLLVFVPVIIFSARKIGRRVRTTTRSGQDKLADIQNILQETITGNRIVKAFSMETWEISRFRAAARKLFRANLRSVRAQAMSGPLMESIGVVAVALLLLFGRDAIKAGLFTTGTYVTFLAAVFNLYGPVRKLAQSYNNFQQAVGASDEMFKLMDAEDDVKQKPNAIALKPFSRGVRFEDVGFSYPGENGDSKPILHDVSLDVRAGEIIAFVGSSGAGKTTLVNLIPRFFDVDSGRITIDGHDIRDVTIGSLRAQIGVVTQETILFNDTVRNNIAYGQPGVSDARVEAAAKAALAHDFIMATPQGYDTIIGEKGLRLSGGERQRIAIARALLKDAPILILDEATSALDTESEALVQSALQNLMSGRTVFVIAHRLSTVRRADRIVVIENGTVADEGTHEDLIKRFGTYKRLYDLQFVDMERV
jgi:subfamily B ATP-binding cassette protein MsbA